MIMTAPKHSEFSFYNAAIVLSFFATFMLSGKSGRVFAEEDLPGGYTQEEINEMINNPLGELWLLYTQSDFAVYEGDALDALNQDDKTMNFTIVSPILSTQFTEEWKAIFRPTIPLLSLDAPKNVYPPTQPGEGLSSDFDRENGLGDIILWSAFAKNDWAKPPNIFGFGPTIMMDTATDDILGAGKWAAGPMALAFHIGDKWIYGAVAQHWWSFAGDGDRDDVSLTDLQYVLRYRLTSETNIGFSPNIRYNWEPDDSDDKLSLPIGLGFDTMIKLGPAPAKVGVELHYYVESPDTLGPEWQVRFFLTPVLPSPGFAKQPLFGR